MTDDVKERIRNEELIDKYDCKVCMHDEIDDGQYPCSKCIHNPTMDLRSYYCEDIRKID